MIYLDANVFIYAACDQSEIGVAARKIITAVQIGIVSAFTSVLTYDEIVWGVRKMIGKEQSIVVGELFLSLPHLLVTETKRETISQAQKLIKEQNLKSRDAIHAATILLAKQTHLISEDPDFDVLPNIIRHTILSFAQTIAKKNTTVKKFN